MKGKVVTCVVSLAILFITASFSQADTFDLAKMNSPPTTPSVLIGETSGLSGTSLSYITKSNDPDGNQLKYSFDWGDGTVSTTCLVNQGVLVKVYHTWKVSPGSKKAFSVKAKATDRYGSASSWSNPISVAVAGSTTQDQVDKNKPPATPSTPSGETSGASGTSYSYTTKGTDPDGDRVKYTFDWGDGTEETTSLVASGTSASASHKWTVASEKKKTFSVKAKATDEGGKDSGWSNPISVTITGPAQVNNPPATPSVPSGSTSGSSGTSYSYTTKGTDPDGNRLKYTFDWGDGTEETTSLVASGTSASASHKWTVASGMTNTFSVKAKATDENGKDSGWSSALSVTIKGPADATIPSVSNNPPRTPYIPYGQIVGYTKDSCPYKTMATDQDNDRVKYTFDWGDGTQSETSYVTSGTYASATHQWPTAEPGTYKGYSIRTMATDEHGAKSAWSDPLRVIMGALYINYRPSNPVLTGPTQGVSGTTYKFTVLSTDKNEGDTIKYRILWGDSLVTETDFYPSGQPVTVYHTWNVPAGKTWNCCIFAVAIDKYLLQSDDFSDVLIFAVKGPSILAQKSGLKAEGDETVFVSTEEANAVDVETNESDFVIAQAEVPNSTDGKTNEYDFADAQIEEADSLDAQNEEADSEDEQTEEDCPFALDDVYFIPSNDSVLKISDPGVLENDQYRNDKTLSVKSYTQPAHAANFAMNPDGSFTYTSSQDYCGEDSFTYRTTDGNCESNEAAVNIFIDCSQQNEEDIKY